MRIHPLNLLIAIFISALLTYGLANVEALSFRPQLAVGGFVTLAATLGAAIGIEFERARAGANARVVAGSFFVLGLVAHAVFAFGWFSATSYVVTAGLLFLLFVLAFNAVASARQ